MIVVNILMQLLKLVDNQNGGGQKTNKLSKMDHKRQCNR